MAAKYIGAAGASVYDPVNDPLLVHRVTLMRDPEFCEERGAFIHWLNTSDEADGAYDWNIVKINGERIVTAYLTCSNTAFLLKLKFATGF